MEDIAPGLIKDVNEEFHRLYDGSSQIKALLEKIKAGTATYAEAQEYSLEVSRLIGQAYEKYVSSATLPDGRMYYNIASRLIPSSMDENYSLVSGYTASVQQALNEKAGIGIKAQIPGKDQDRIDGLVDLASNAEQYDDVAKQLLTAFDTYSQSIVDESVRTNADFHYQSGIQPQIIRKTGGKCCEWCRGLAGRYDYPDVPKDVYRRHANCRCLVEYDPADGSKIRQSVHNKLWTNPDSRDIMDVEKNSKKRRNRFRSASDPMAEVMGPAELSHPEEIQGFIDEINASGVELIRHEKESLGYCPGFFPGQPGQISISHNASYSAWCHEMQHMRDDRASGWQGMRIMADKDLCVERERRAYDVEIQLAIEAGREDIADRLRMNFEEERRRIYGNG